MTQLLLTPYITEKSSAEMIQNKFTFLSIENYEKIQVKNYLTAKYDISIKSIRVLKKLSKKVRRGKFPGKTKSFKKIIIKLANDKNIEKIKELF